ncbi:MAG TPA: class I SAM-dependent methyltransferase [Patescibacteria group bacterium]|nr:class I SAM-dependent methyltransferase [Patescibacteria group bacterium]
MGRGTSFDEAARDYDEVRPGYPEELVEDVIALSGIPDGGRILEVGCGTGQATIPFAEWGYRMVSIDVGGELASMARSKCSRYPSVEVLTVSFEDFVVKSGSFDLVISATAFHWIPPEVGYPKAARALNDSGSIALFWNMHPTPYTGFFEDVQRVYGRIVPEWRNPEARPTTDERIRETVALVDGTGLFGEVQVRRYPWSKTFSSGDYLRLLNTFSDHRSLEEERRADLFEGIRSLIDGEYGGAIERPYLSVLYVARKRV